MTKKIIFSHECPWGSVLSVTVSNNEVVTSQYRPEVDMVSENSQHPIEVNDCMIDARTATKLAHALLEAAEANPPKIIAPRAGGTARFKGDKWPVRDIWGVAPTGAVWLSGDYTEGQSYTRAEFSDDWEVLS